MKIAFLHISFGIVERGSEIFVDEIAKRLAKNHEVTVFAAGSKPDTAYRIIHVPVSQSFLRGFFYDLAVFWFTLRCLPVFWREKYDWIIPVNGRWQAVLIRLVRFFRGGKILISGHAGIGFDDHFNISRGKPDIFVALSASATFWAKQYTKSRVVYIPNGVNLDLFNPTVPAAAVTLPRPVVLCVSALLAYKRIDRLIRALARIKEGSLLLIGDGPLREKVTAMGKTALDGRFLHIPYVPYAQMGSYYRASNLFSLPSRETEAFGLVYLEALACNIAVVAPDDENRRAIIGEAGRLCNVEDEKLYADSLVFALRKDFGDIPHKQAEKFSWDTITENYENVLTDAS